jgi:hypothetical protein
MDGFSDIVCMMNGGGGVISVVYQKYPANARPLPRIPAAEERAEVGRMPSRDFPRGRATAVMHREFIAAWNYRLLIW